MTLNKDRIVRFFLLLIGGLIGTCISVCYIYLKWDQLQGLQRDSFREQMALFQTCVVFIICVYNVGYYGMRLMKMEEQAEEIRENKRLHTLFLNFLLVFLFVMSYIFER